MDSIEYLNELLQKRSRELQFANSQNPREVCKEENNKINKDNSRSSEEYVTSKVSNETCLLASTSSLPVAGTSSEESLEKGTLCQEKGGNVNQPAGTSIRGISIQHAKSKSGIKVMVNVQTHSDAEEGSFVELTAELKRSDRLRELKPYDEDSENFNNMYMSAIDELKSMKPAERKEFCVGRLHDRGVRDTWYADMMMIGRLDEAGHLYYALLNINGEEFEIHLNETLSPKQSAVYHSSGRWGNFATQKRAPRLETAPRKVWK